MAKKRSKAKKRSSSPESNETKNAPKRRRAKKSEPARKSASPEGCLVVGVGASSAGWESLKRFLEGLPSDAGMAFVVVHRVDGPENGSLVDVLARSAPMPVVEIEDRTPVGPNRIYVVQRKAYVRLEDGTLFLDEPGARRGLRTPIDAFFRSLASSCSDGAAAVLLSGTGKDGARGLRDVRAAGGVSFAQEVGDAEETRSDVADYVLPVEEMPAALRQHARRLRALADERAAPAEAWSEPLERILDLLNSQTQYDFRFHKQGTLRRRIQRRVGLSGAESLEDYAEKLTQDREEAQALFRDLLVGVTGFFRDKEAWNALERQVLDAVVSEKAPGESVRVWVPGCATGEEAYSIAIALQEACLRGHKPLEIQVFGTDINEAAIRTARAGVYPGAVAAEIAEPRLERFFRENGDEFRVRQSVRGSVVFAVQNVLSDPPFTNLDLVSCRNLLIYLEPFVQKKLLRLFHFALLERGFLFLGASESAANGKELFSPLSPTWRIFRKSGEPSERERTFPVVPTRMPRPASRERASNPGVPAHFGLVELARKALLDQFAPPSVLVDEHLDVRYFHGALRDYLPSATEAATHGVLEMASEAIREPLGEMVQRSVSERRSASAVVDGGEGAVRIDVEPVGTGEDRNLFLISFTKEPGSEESGSARGASSMERRVTSLAGELEETRERLQSTIEELETANEELQAANEEAVSTNEELQSANEALEASRAELEEVNQELSAVNGQLKEKVTELAAANNDLSNLFLSTEVAAVFLDRALRLRRFTPACADLLQLRTEDLGRPIADLSLPVDDPSLHDDARTVLKKLTRVEREIRGEGGQTFIRRVLPYRTSNDTIEGVVLTFTDVSRLHAALRQLERRERQQAAVARLGRLALAPSELPELFDEAVRLLIETLEVDYAKALQLLPDGNELRLVAGVGWKDGLVGNATVGSGLDSQAGWTLQSAKPVVVEDLASEKRFRGPQLLVDHGVVSGLSVIIGPEDEPWGVLGAHTRERREFTVDDVNLMLSVAHVLTEAVRRGESERLLRDRERRLNLVTDAMPVLIAYCDRNLVYRFCNGRYQEWFGLAPKDVVGKTVPEVIGEEAFQRLEPHIEKVLAGERVSLRPQLSYRHGAPRHVHIEYVPHFSEGGEVLGYYAMILDVSKDAEAEHTRARLAAIVQHSNDAIMGKTLDGTVTDWNAAAERMYGFTAQEMIGQSIAKIFPEDREHELDEILGRLRSGEAIERFETVRRRKDGTLVDVSLTVSPIRDASGVAAGASVIARDIGKQKKVERELQEWTDRLEERVAERTAVAEKRAEDLRELAAQINEAELRVRKRLAQAIHDDLQQVLVAAKMRVPTGEEIASAEELSVVSDLLDEAIGMTRTLVSELSPPVIREGSLEDAFKWLARQMRKHYALDVKLKGEEDLGEVGEKVKTVVVEVVRELLFNVVKHAETDSATISMTRELETLLIEVSDSGCGFDPEAAVKRTEGFGLFSSRERVAAFGGAMEVESAPGKGARFSITIPISTGKPQARSAPPAEVRTGERRLSRTNPGPIRILVADDHRIMREGLVRILSVHGGLEVVGEAADGQEAVDKALELRPDVVVMDITMPGLNGIEATRELAERLPDTVVIGLSLHGQEDLGSAMKQAGAVAYLQKDEASTGLIEAIQRHCPIDA